MPKKQLTWTPDMIQLLGKMPDNRVVQELEKRGIKTSTFPVRKMRIRQGIPAYNSRSERQKRALIWTPEMIELLGSDDDYIVAEKLKKLGVFVSTNTVQKARQKRGIPAFDSKNRRPWPSEILAMLGEEYDHVVAKEYERIAGVSISIHTIQKKRRKLGRMAAKEVEFVILRVERFLGFCSKNRLSIVVYLLSEFQVREFPK